MIIALGVFFLLTPFIPRLNREWRPDALISRAGSGGPIIAGAAFAVAWTPCIGPTLGAILNVAATQDSVGKGGVLLAFYSLGLAVPFLLTAVAFTRMTTAFKFLRNHYLAITALSGVVLITMGLLLFTGELAQLNIKAQEAPRLPGHQHLQVDLGPVAELRHTCCGTSAAPRATHAAHVAEPRIASACGPRHWRLHHIRRADHSSTGP